MQWAGHDNHQTADSEDISVLLERESSELEARNDLVLTCTITHSAHVFRVLIRDPDGEAASLRDLKEGIKKPEAAKEGVKADLMMAISRLQVDAGTVHAADTRDRGQFVFNRDFWKANGYWW